MKRKDNDVYFSPSNIFPDSSGPVIFDGEGIKYRSGYTEQLAETYRVMVPISIDEPIHTFFISLLPTGELTIWRGYAWDGTSAPVLNRRKTMRASLIHDVLYQLIRMGHGVKRIEADALFRDMCIEDGVHRWLAFIYYHALRRFGKVAAMARSAKREFRAP